MPLRESAMSRVCAFPGCEVLIVGPGEQCSRHPDPTAPIEMSRFEARMADRPASAQKSIHGLDVYVLPTKPTVRKESEDEKPAS